MTKEFVEKFNSCLKSKSVYRKHKGSHKPCTALQLVVLKDPWTNGFVFRSWFMYGRPLGSQKEFGPHTDCFLASGLGFLSMFVPIALIVLFVRGRFLLAVTPGWGYACRGHCFWRHFVNVKLFSASISCKYVFLFGLCLGHNFWFKPFYFKTVVAKSKNIPIEMFKVCLLFFEKFRMAPVL